jgi:hypothetical protein
LKNPTGASGGNNAGPAKKNDKDDKRKKRDGSRPSRKKPKKNEVRKEASGPEEQASDREDSEDREEEEEEASNGGMPISRQGNVVSELKPAWFAPGVTFNATAAKMREWLGQLKLPKNGVKAELQARLHTHLLAAEQAVE